ncbi:MAG: hypothetical protein H7175_04805 [Burkholderiales bacterium]|nr:hypothetical protein [Anaerolineae bacterium]
MTQTTTSRSIERPLRPFGLTLAILASVVLFSVLPLMQIALVLSVRQHFSQQDYQFGEDGVQAIASGGDVLGIGDTELLLRGVIAVAFLVIGIAAWIGRPRAVHALMLVAVLALALGTIAANLLPILNARALETGVTSGDTLGQPFRVAELVLTLLVPLYVVWYMNRGPARAFYRGNYLPLPAEREG